MKTLILVICAFTLSCAHVPRVVKLPIPPLLTEAPSGFSLMTNGFEDQPTMDADRAQFEQPAAPGVLGPFFNNSSCVACHFNPVTGGNSGIFEHRIGPDDSDDHQVAPAGLIHDASINPAQQQRAPLDATNALRRTPSLLGDAFVAAIPDWVFLSLSKNGGQYIKVPILEAPGTVGIGRFGWKDQHASLLSFAGDAACNEMGEENRLVNGFHCDNKPPTHDGIEDNDNSTPARPEDIDNYFGFMSSLMVPPRGPITAQVKHGQAIFEHIGCIACHVGAVPAPPKVIHPFGDYLLHDVGTGDGIAQAGGPANKVRTAPLWGLRTVARFLHDGRATTIPAAILAHKGEAKQVTKRYQNLSRTGKADLLAFLLSL